MSRFRPDGRLQYVQNVATPHPTRDDVAFQSYASTGEEARHSIEVVPSSGPVAKAEAPPSNLVWLDENRLLLYPFDKTELEPLVAPANAPSQREPIGEWFPPRYVLGIDQTSARVIWHCPGADAIRSTCPDAMPRTRIERELPKVLRKLGDHARCLDPASAETSALFVLAKNGRRYSAATSPSSSAEMRARGHALEEPDQQAICAIMAAAYRKRRRRSSWWRRRITMPATSGTSQGRPSPSACPSILMSRIHAARQIDMRRFVVHLSWDWRE